MSLESFPSIEFDRRDETLAALLDMAEVHRKRGYDLDRFFLDGKAPPTEVQQGKFTELYVTYDYYEYAGEQRKFGFVHLTEDYDAMLHGHVAKNWRVGVLVGSSRDPESGIPLMLREPGTALLAVSTNEGRLIDTQIISLDTVEGLVLAESAPFADLPRVLERDGRLIHGK